MLEPFYLGAYWGDRAETPQASSSRLSRFLRDLRTIDPTLGLWYPRTGGKSATRTPIDPESDAVERMLDRGRNRRDVGGTTIESLGRTFGLWNRSAPAVALAGTVGISAATPGLLNHIVLSFPPPEGDALRLYDRAVAGKILSAAVGAWGPDWATWASNSMRVAQAPEPREPVVGWLTYLSNERDVPALQGVSIDRLEQGQVFEAASSVLSLRESDLGRLRAGLRAAGGLLPTP